MHQRTAIVYWPSEAKTIEFSSNNNNNNNNNKNEKQQQQEYLIGWNVRDFTIVIAAIVSTSSPVEELREAIRTLQPNVNRLCFSEHERASAPFLTIVGVLSSNHDDFDTLQKLRGSSTAFIEMERIVKNNNSSSSTNNLPKLRSLYTSSIKFDATLHLFCYQEKLFDVRKAPLPFSPLVRLGIDDVNNIIAGKNASRVLKGAQSVLEGPFLPPHALNLMPPLHPRHLAPRSVNTGSFTMVNPPEIDEKTGKIKNNSDISSRMSFASQYDDADNNNNNYLDDTEVELDVRLLDPSTPPRLQYPTAASLTDLSCCRSCLSGSAYVQSCFEEKNKSSTTTKKNTNSNTSNSEDNKESKNKGTIESLLSSIAAAIAPFVAVLLQISIFLAKFSYMGATLEYKLREWSNVLALIQRKTTTCGLHPVLPHTLCGLHGERRTCLYAFAARQVVGDILLGVCLSWVLAFHSDSVFEFMRKFAWFGLHGMHVRYFEWFHGYPAGFKMNADLNEALFMTTNKTMQVYDVIVGFVSQYVDVYRVSYMLLGVISTFGGASLALSFVADCCNLASLHIRFLYHYIAFFYHSLTTVTSSFLLLMREKKRNPLKNRVDDASFEFDEVVLGTMGCCACAFLIPTVALYYLYLATCRTVIWVVQETIRGVAVLCCNVPIYPGFLWLTRRKQWLLTGGVVLANVRARAIGSTSTVTSSSSSNKPDKENTNNQKHDQQNNTSNSNNMTSSPSSATTGTSSPIGMGSASNSSPFQSQQQQISSSILQWTIMNEEDAIIENAFDDDQDNDDSSSSKIVESDVIGDVVFMSLPFMAIFHELLLLINLLFSGTLSIPRILRFIWFADANSKPVVDVPNKIFRHLTADPAHPVLMRGELGKK